MITVVPIRVDDMQATGVRVELPDSPPLLLVVGRTGFVMCGFLNVDAAEKVGVAAAVVSGVKSFDDVLAAEVRAATSRAQSSGVRRGMTGKEALRFLL